MSYQLVRIMERNDVTSRVAPPSTTYTYIDDEDGTELTTTELLVDVQDVQHVRSSTRTEKRFARGAIETTWSVR